MSLSCKCVDAKGGELTISINPLRTLGKGRAAIARLVEVEGLFKHKILCVEKVFRPGLLTRLVYWCFFQSPFPYRYSRDAVLACLHRRKVAARIIAMGGVDIEISTPYYVRWDEEVRAYVFGAEFIKGRGLRVDEVDERVCRRFLHNNIVGQIGKWSGHCYVREERKRSEAKDLLKNMKAAEKLFRKSGLTGSGWQVASSALVSTANFISSNNHFTLVDLESGIPSILVPYYFFRSLLKGRFPYFDDIEDAKLQAFMESNKEAFIKRLGENEFEELQNDVSLLIEHTNRWKEGEIALFRNHIRLFSPQVISSIKKARAEVWLKEGILDARGFERFAETKRFFTSGLFLAGIFPSRIGRFLRKLLGNYTYREDLKRFLKDSNFRRRKLRAYMDEHAKRWAEQERIEPNRMFSRFWGRFTLHLFLSRLTPRGLHRFISDGAQRKKIAATALFFVISEKFQTEYAKFVVFRRMREWVKDGRLSPEEAKSMKERVEDGSIQEYVRVFGLHVALKFLEPVTSGIKLVGTGWFLKIFVANYPELNPHGELTLGLLKAFMLTFLHNPIPVIMMVNTSVWRTLITLWRMLSIKRRHISYKVALVIGIIPAFGSLAYPMQMYWRCKELSLFLIRDILAVFAHKVPIYGGKHALTEVWAVRMADFPAEMMDVTKTFFSRVKSVLRRKKLPARTAVVPQAASNPEASAGISGYNPSHGNSSAGGFEGKIKKPGRFDGIVEEMISKIWERYDREYAGKEF